MGNAWDVADFSYTWGRWLVLGLLFLLVLYHGRNAFSAVRLGREAALLLAALFTYFAVRELTEGSTARAEANAAALVDLERALGIFWEPSMQRAIVDYHALVTLANWVYIWGHWPLISLVAVWLFLRRPAAYRLYRNAFMVSGAVGLGVFMTFPVAPPRLADLEVLDTVTAYSHAYRVLQPPSLINRYAAVPSLHFGWNLLIGIALVREASARWARLLGLLVPPAMFLAIVLTANHFILDGVAGAAVALLGLGVAARLWPQQARRRAAAPASGTLPDGVEPGAMRSLPLPEVRPLTVAHRAANDLTRLREAQAAGVDMVEGDLWLYRGRLEVRHLKTLGPVPILWDRWTLATRWTWGLELAEVLAAMRPGTGLLLDLKGTDRRLPDAVAEAVAERGRDVTVAVCSRNWALLEPFNGRPEVTVVHSVGSLAELRRVAGWLTGHGRHAVSVHQRLLTPEVIRVLKERARAVLTWPVNSEGPARRLLAWGVDGIISDDLDLLRRAVSCREAGGGGPA